jgi:hypothetical protein
MGRTVDPGAASSHFLGAAALAALLVAGTEAPLCAQEAKQPPWARHVRVTAKADKPDASGKQAITINLDIDDRWHAFANPVGCEELESAQTVVRIKGAVEPNGVKVDYPPGRLIKEPILGIAYRIYEKKASIRAVVQRAAGGSGPLQISVFVQSVSDICVPPYTYKLTIP